MQTRDSLADHINSRTIATGLACGRSSCECDRTAHSGHGLTHCPAHGDEHPSLSIAEADSGTVLVHCLAGCEQDAVIVALRDRGLWGSTASGGRGGDTSSRKRFEPSNPYPGGLTIDELAAAKHLPAAHLRYLGLREWHPSVGRTIVVIPFRDPAGREQAIHYRQALEGTGRFFWRKSDRPIPYGLDRLEEARRDGWILIVEGESDCWTAWINGLPALGIPGKTAWPADFAPALRGLQVYIWQEPAAEDFSERIGRDIPDARIIVAPDGVKDISAAHVEGLDLLALVEEWKSAAIPFEQIRQQQAEAELARNAAEAHALLVAPDLLERLGSAIHAQGYAGDLRPPLLLYVAMTSRLLERPQNIAVVSQSAAGKNRTVDAAAGLLPPEALYTVKAGSPHALIYSDEDFHERVVIFSEADSIPDEGPAASAVRALAEDNAMQYDVPERDPKTSKFVVRRITKPGPTGLITTSTRSVRNQLGTRVLELALAEDEAQTRDVMRAHASHARRPTRRPFDPSAFFALQRWLALSGARHVEVPFAETLVDLVPAKEVRMRRDFRQLLTCIQAIALLHQCQRGRAEGWVIATLDDYAAAYDLLAPLFEAIARDGLTAVVRATVDAVSEGEEVTEATLAQRLGVSKATIHYRIDRAIRGGWLVNSETRKYHPAKLSRGAPLPEAASALPSPEHLRAVWEGFEGSNDFQGDRSPPPPPSDSSDSGDADDAGDEAGGRGSTSPSDRFEPSNPSDAHDVAGVLDRLASRGTVRQFRDGVVIDPPSAALGFCAFCMQYEPPRHEPTVGTVAGRPCCALHYSKPATAAAADGGGGA